MVFWYVYYLFAVTILFMMYAWPKSTRELKYAYISVLWLIASFRYMYGDDYEMYVSLFEAGDISNVLVMAPSIEPTFQYMVQLYNEIGLSAQCLFLTYATVILFFFYKGCQAFFSDSKSQLMLLLLYATTTLTGGYFFGLNGIRQAAAISILFWGSRFLLSSEWLKFASVFILAFCFHYSAVFFLPAIFLVKKKIPYVYALGGMAAALVCTLSGMSAQIFLRLLSFAVSLSDAYNRYENQIDMLDISTEFPPSTVFACMIYLTILVLIYCKRIKLDTRSEIFIYNATTVYILLRSFTSFGVEGANLAANLHRIEVYYLFSFLLFIIYFLQKIFHDKRSMEIGFLTVWILVFAYVNLHAFAIGVNDPKKVVPPSVLTDRIEDQFNFSLLNPYVW